MGSGCGGRFEFQRSAVRIQSLAKFILKLGYCQLPILKRRKLRKRGWKWSIYKTLDVYDAITFWSVNFIWPSFSVTKKLSNVYKNCPKMISLEKL